MSKARSNRAPGAGTGGGKKENEAELGEFESLLGRYRDKGEEEEALGGAAAQVAHGGKAGRKAALALSSNQKGNANRASPVPTSPGSNFAGEVDKENAPPPSKIKKTAATKAKKAPTTKTAAPAASRAKSARAAPSRSKRRVVADSDEDDEADDDDGDFYV